MTLPTFLGIGVAKAGTTWLYELLHTHPEVYLPRIVKDVRFFDTYYDKGVDWYQSFFPSEDRATNYKAIGEFTAFYLYCEECPQRMADVLDKPKLILMLRHPVDRVWSNYLHIARLRNYQDSFERFLEENTGGTSQSFYSEHIRRYQAVFGPDQLLILLFDQVFKDVAATRNTLAEYLEIDPYGFPEDAGKKIVNKGYIPRYRSIYAMVARGAWFAQNHHLHWPVYVAKKMGVKKIISKKGDQPERMNDETRQMLLGTFDNEVSELEDVLKMDLSHWRI